MRRIRKWLLAAAVTVALLLPLASIASADPGDGDFATYFSAGLLRTTTTK